MIPKQEPLDGNNYKSTLSCVKTEDEATNERGNESRLEGTNTKDDPNTSPPMAAAVVTLSNNDESPTLRHLHRIHNKKRISDCRGPSSWYWISTPSTSSSRPIEEIETTPQDVTDTAASITPSPKEEAVIAEIKQEFVESAATRSSPEEVPKAMPVKMKKEHSSDNETTNSSPEHVKEAVMILLRDELAPNLSTTTKGGSSTWCWLPPLTSSNRKRETPTSTAAAAASASAKTPKKIKSEPFDEKEFIYKPPEEVSLGWYWLKNPDGSFAMGSSKFRRKYASKRKKNPPEKSSKSSRKLSNNQEVEGAWHWLKNPDGSFVMGSGKARRKYARKRKKPPPVKSSKPFPKLQQKNLSWYWLKASDGSFAMGSGKIRSKCVEESDNDDFESDASFGFDEDYEARISRNTRDADDERWEKQFQLLVEYKNKHNTTRVHRGSDNSLGLWVGLQRQKFRNQKLTEYRQRRLKSIGFEFDPLMIDWRKMYNQLLSYKEQHNGSTRVPYAKPYRKLGNWVHHQKLRYVQQTLSQEKQDLLKFIGFEWKISEMSEKKEQLHRTAWMEMYRRLVAYKRKHKTTCVPRKYEDDPKLGRWVQWQRDGCIKPDRVDLLNKIGFEWNPKQTDWLDMYRRLVAYKAEHNSTRVPHRFKADPKLGVWVTNQRLVCKRKDRVDLLNEIGFDWDPLQEDWMDMYQQLIEYKAEHNTTEVPWDCEACSKLYWWILYQRRFCKRKDRVDLLNEIGFDWDPTGVRSKSTSR